MTWHLQDFYYAAAAIAAVAATIVNVIVLARIVPSRLTARINEATGPIVESIKRLAERVDKESAAHSKQSAHQEDSIAALERKVDDKMETLQRSSNAQDKTLTRIEAIVSMGITRRDLDTLHHRVTDVAKSAAATTEAVDTLQTRITNIEGYLREKKV